ncbi:Ergosterol biosynthetic protein 28 [Schizosaccharomyces pombe 972h-] [Rhizoctonia solani]|uniref:Ergosterol biosynthetic protein 28 [Schizosaccharomyces pombe 972h-] n=1 Tax=Rhizoctonia solani TaxID=456999 RepID=A0A0K6GBU5_9AGAM|nr:Ergosterol biosynthetic protein 28 [Schizosaccharomyces pombe 972h-] [Rhizoctonia solani]
MSGFLPQAVGLLPKWQLVVSSLAVFNTIQNFLTLSLTKRIYNKEPHNVTALQSRTFAIWTLTSAILRFYCAYHVNEKVVYDLTMWTYVLAFGHFTSEFLIYRTAGLGPGLLSPVIVAMYLFVLHCIASALGVAGMYLTQARSSETFKLVR